MITETDEFVKLIAEEGMTLTNGKAFGKMVYLGCTDSPDNWREITDEMAIELQKKEENDVEQGS